MDHHPDVLLYSYKKVKVSTITHQVSSLTEKDYEIAEAIDDALAKTTE